MKAPKHYRRYGVPSEIMLTDSMGKVVTHKKKRNRLWRIFSFPFRFVASCFHWLMESKTKARSSDKRIPPGLA